MKALRFFLIGVAGKVIRTGRKIYLKFSGMPSVCEIFYEARRRMVYLKALQARLIIIVSRGVFLFMSPPRSITKEGRLS